MKKAVVIVLSAILASLVIAAAWKPQEKTPSYGKVALSKIAGLKLYELKNCGECHTLKAQAEGERTPMKSAREGEWFASHVGEHSEVVLRQERSERRKRRTAEEEVEALRAYLFEATADEKKLISAMPKSAFEGAFIAKREKCTNCHMFGGEGKDTGPDLSDVGPKHDRNWFMQNLIDPKQFAPDTDMPSFEELPKEELNKIIDYLQTLK